MRWWNGVSHFLDKVLMAVACIILAGTTLSLSAEALARTFFSRTWGLMEELPSLFMPYLVFLLLGVALKRNLHVSVGQGRSRGRHLSRHRGRFLLPPLWRNAWGKGILPNGTPNDDGDRISFVGFLSLTGHRLWSSALVCCGDVREIDPFYDDRSALPRMPKGE